jgi:serine/threonine protein kinase
VHPDEEQNWSGRGEHVTFDRHERKLVNEILQEEDLLGSTNTAVVQSVRCRRILLARKTIRCGRVMTQSEATNEVAHLKWLSHAHIVRVIGTYTLGQELSILLYPVAQYNLETFLQKIVDDRSLSDIWRRRDILQPLIACLSNAVSYIHQMLIKHMDIKPKNILVRKKNDLKSVDSGPFSVYIADFGIARAYTSLEAASSDGPTMFTRKYAAPEVVDYEQRDQSADIFSLGCVMTEMAAVMAGTIPIVTGNTAFSKFAESCHHLDVEGDVEGMLLLEKVLKANNHGDTSYQANIGNVQAMLEMISKRSDTPVGDSILEQEYPTTGLWGLPCSCEVDDFVEDIQIIREMLNINRSLRPTAKELAKEWGTRECCVEGPPTLESS